MISHEDILPDDLNSRALSVGNMRTGDEAMSTQLLEFQKVLRPRLETTR